MASSSGEPCSSTATAATMDDAKLMVALATSCGDCQHLKEVVLSNQEYSTSSMVASGKNTDAPLGNTFSAAINPLLLASACTGSLKGLDLLLNSKVAAGDQRVLPFALESQRFCDLISAYTSSDTCLETQRIPPHDDPEALLAGMLLEGVTVDGDTVLHALATYGENDDFQKCAQTVCSKARQLLFKQNKNGDTPLHCAARSGKSQMLSCLIGLARGGGGDGSSSSNGGSTDRVKGLLGTENELKETALHEAVRIGDNDMVVLLLKGYPELASFPKDGTSNTFENIIVETLYSKSNEKLPYSGQKGQNALHAAVLRGTGMISHKTTNQHSSLGNKNLTTERDEKGSTPLHFAAAKYFDVVRTQLGLIKPFAAVGTETIARKRVLARTGC
uniref:Uncharacterized protein n=1 Tax=Oryza punctata TaxID=4537 RepID=A0A0E0LZS6_ORYPU